MLAWLLCCAAPALLLLGGRSGVLALSAALLLLLLMEPLLKSSTLLSLGPKSLYGLQRVLCRTAWSTAAESGLLPCWYLPLLLSVCC
jgi:hypothetical protein